MEYAGLYLRHQIQEEKYMFGENLKTLRNKKGYTQENLAIKINVVRQTVSKWEKGLSVPDADTLQKIAEVLEVEVSELLGAPIVQSESKNEVAEQLARINEQLAIKNRRWKRFWKVVAIVLILIVVLNILGIMMFGYIKNDSETQIETEEILIEE